MLRILLYLAAVMFVIVRCTGVTEQNKTSGKGNNMDIQTTAAQLPYDEDDTPHLFTTQEIKEYEHAVGASFPEDFVWYMQNKGTQRLEFEHRYFIDKSQEVPVIRRYEGVEHPYFVLSTYKKYLEKVPADFLPHDQKLYFPFAVSKGDGRTTSWAAGIFINLNSEDRGSIWLVSHGYFVKERFGNETLPPPRRIAENLAVFLNLLSTEDTLEEEVKKAQAETLQKYLHEYIKQGHNTPTEQKDPKKLMYMLFQAKKAENFSYNKAYNVAFNFLTSGRAVTGAADFAAQADGYARSYQPLPGTLHRNKVEIKQVVLFQEEYPYFDYDNTAYHIADASCELPGGIYFTERYVLYKNTATGLFSVVRLHESQTKPFSVKKLGKMVYSSGSFGWELQKKLSPAWSKVPLEMQVFGDVDALTPELVAFMQETVTRKNLREKLEVFLYNHYITVDYPEFLAMDEEEQKDRAEAYPKITAPKKVWKLISEGSLYFEDNKSFNISFYWSPDEEHGINLIVTGDTIQLR